MVILYKKAVGLGPPPNQKGEERFLVRASPQSFIPELFYSRHDNPLQRAAEGYARLGLCNSGGCVAPTAQGCYNQTHIL